MRKKIIEKLKEKQIIQGGMGAGVSNYRLAQTVANHPSKKTLGVISGVALEQIQLRRLQQGNEEVRDILLEYPDREIGRAHV